jgi:UDP-N-acetylmuramate dehydrogenase
LKIQSNYSLKRHNTFGIDCKAALFIEVTSEEELVDFLRNSPLKADLKLILGGGSNMLLTKDIDGLVLHISIKGKRVVSQNDESAIIEAKGGENWHDLVVWAIEQNLGGIENLSLIPGNSGTAPMQNIGAYGVELKDVFESLDAIEIETGKKLTFDKQTCEFGYRESIFKHAAKGKFIITSIRLKLSKPPHSVSTHYGAIKTELAKRNISEPTIKDVSEAVIAIRQSKLPDPKEIGNSGSFFKNPIVEEVIANQLERKHGGIPIYPAQTGYKKLAAGWLIEQAGWKGYRKGEAGVHKKQALVLVNYGNATGDEVLDLAKTIIKDVHSKFGIELIPEVNVI